MNTTAQAEALLAAAGFTGVSQRWRVAALARILDEHPDARVEVCSDERTGQRYGQAKCRRGRCAKVGHSTFRYQIWAVWDSK